VTVRLLLGILAAVLALAGCSSDAGSDPGSEPADPTPAPPSSSPPESADTPAPTGDPLSFGSSGSVTIRCFPDGVRRMVFFDSVITERPVTLAGLEAGGDALRVTSTWVRELDRREVTEGGLVDLRPGRSVPDRWPGARPLEGVGLEPDERYSFYVLAGVRPEARFRDFELRWADDRTSDSSTYRFRGRTRSGGC
jgi:hypothetical protein